MKNKTKYNYCESFGNLKTQTPSFELLLQPNATHLFTNNALSHVLVVLL